MLYIFNSSPHSCIFLALLHSHFHNCHCISCIRISYCLHKLWYINGINQYNTQLLRIASTISSLPNIVLIVFIVEYLSIDTISFCYADVMMRSWWILADVMMMSWWCQHLFSFWFYYGRTHSILRSAAFYHVILSTTAMSFLIDDQRTKIATPRRYISLID